MKIHKAAIPKEAFTNPRLCRTKSKLYNSHSITKFHSSSRTKWNKVTCKKCLKMRKQK